MRLKYIIPLAIGALLVLAAMPAYASEIYLYPASSQVQTNHNPVWISHQSEHEYTSSGDKLVWNAWWGHYDDNYQGTYQAFGTDEYSNLGYREPSADYYNPGQALSYYLTYHQSNGGPSITYNSVSGTPTWFSRWHNYAQSGYQYVTSEYRISLN
jgi:hypothetical protein